MASSRAKRVMSQCTGVLLPRFQYAPSTAATVGHRTDAALAPQQPIGKGRNIAHVDPGANPHTAAAHGGRQLQRDQGADGSENQAGIQQVRRGWSKGRPPAHQGDAAARRCHQAGERVHGLPTAQGDLNRQVRRAPTVKPQVAGVGSHLQGAANQPGAQQRRGGHRKVGLGIGGAGSAVYSA